LSDSPAVVVARAYTEAWASKDITRARTYLADNFQFDSVFGNLSGIEEFINAPAGLATFASGVVPGTLRWIAASGDETNAMVMYQVSHQRGLMTGAEHFTVTDGKLTTERLSVFTMPQS
jgi:hypothetical protein